MLNYLNSAIKLYIAKETSGPFSAPISYLNIASLILGVAVRPRQHPALSVAFFHVVDTAEKSGRRRLTSFIRGPQGGGLRTRRDGQDIHHGVLQLCLGLRKFWCNFWGKHLVLLNWPPFIYDELQTFSKLLPVLIDKKVLWLGAQSYEEIATEERQHGLCSHIASDPRLPQPPNYLCGEFLFWSELYLCWTSNLF